MVAELKQHERLCFVCGQENPFGLQVRFKFINQKAIGIFRPNGALQSYPDVLHGGIVSCLLDSAMNRVLMFQKKSARTGRISIRFKQEANIKNCLYVLGEIVKMRKNFALAKAEVRNKQKELIALGEATFILSNEMDQKNNRKEG